jgi:proteasome lid subunit RPN8/RPN11
VIGDVHTHPGSSVWQSDIDVQNPMVAQKGHVALIIPDFAAHSVQPEEVGVHHYVGNGWQTWTGKDAARRLFIRRLL